MADKIMKIVLFGDSITDMGRNRETNEEILTYGNGYAFLIASELSKENPNCFQVLNRGIGGNRTVDLYARIKSDVWNETPNVLSILIGVNDVWHNVDWNSGVEIDRFEKVYSMMIEETLSRLPDTKIILCEPFVLRGSATAEKFEEFKAVYEYAKIVKSLAEKYCLFFLPLQKKFDEAAKKFGAEKYLYDGVHPAIAGATLIADEWLKLFRERILR